jgi:FixJ family two-component response regulator
MEGRLPVGEAIVLIAVKDAVLADSLRFSLELEGYEARLWAPPFEPAENTQPRACLLLDQDVFTTVLRCGDDEVIRRLGIPIVLMAHQSTRLLSQQAKRAGVASIVEKPLLGGILFDTIRMVLEAEGAIGKE